MVPASRPAHCAGRAPSDVPIGTPSAHQLARAWFAGPAGSDQGDWHVMSLIHTGAHPTSCTARHTGRAYLTAAASAGRSDLPPSRLRCRPRLPHARTDRTISHRRAFARAPSVRRRLLVLMMLYPPPDLILELRSGEASSSNFLPLGEPKSASLAGRHAVTRCQERGVGEMRWLAASGRALLRAPGVARCQACRCQGACGPLVVPQRESCSAWASSIAAGWRHHAGIASRRAAAVASVTRQGLQPGAQTLCAGALVQCQCMLCCSTDTMEH